MTGYEFYVQPNWPSRQITDRLIGPLRSVVPKESGREQALGKKTWEIFEIRIGDEHYIYVTSELWLNYNY